MMFQNILKWTFKIVVGGVEKELNIHLDGDTPLQAVEEVAMQMIAHCAKVKELQTAQTQKSDLATTESETGQESNVTG